MECSIKSTTFSRLLLTCILAISLFVTTSLGQQYKGDVIPNSLPASIHSEIAFFNVKDRYLGDTTLINYSSLTASGARPDPLNLQRLVLCITGANRDPWNCFSAIYNALQGAKAINPDINEDSVALISPYFPNGLDKNKAYPYVNGKSNTSALVWKGSRWSDGDNNVYPSGQETVSSYDALDQILEYYSDRLVYPNMRQIVVAGHSMGAQTVHRYSAVANELLSTVPITYWIGNPNSFLWFNSSRPIESSAETCPGYNDWRFGLDNYTNDYSNALVNGLGAGAVYLRYQSRNIGYARGLNDHGDASSSCAPYSTGTDRGSRFLNFMQWFSPDSGDTVDYIPGIGHDLPGMTGSQAGIYRLFIDNFNGNGSKHADFGPRQLPPGGPDDPHPRSGVNLKRARAAEKLDEHPNSILYGPTIVGPENRLPQGYDDVHRRDAP